MAMVVITSSNKTYASEYIESLCGKVNIEVLTPWNSQSEISHSLDSANGLLLTGESDISSHFIAETPMVHPNMTNHNQFDYLESIALTQALDNDIPVLAICRGMQMLNMVFGGKSIKDVPNHDLIRPNVKEGHAKHQIYISPGSKLAAILGSGGFFRVNSFHHQGLKEAQKAPTLLASAYSVEDGIIEGLESTIHQWVIGVQFNPEKTKEVPNVFKNIFVSFVERATCN